MLSRLAKNPPPVLLIPGEGFLFMRLYWHAPERCADGADRTQDGPHHHAPPLGGMGGGGGPRRGAALLCQRPGPPCTVGGLGPEMPFIFRHTARPGHGQQGGRVAGRSAVGRRCRPPVPPVARCL